MLKAHPSAIMDAESASVKWAPRFPLGQGPRGPGETVFPRLSGRVTDGALNVWGLDADGALDDAHLLADVAVGERRALYAFNRSDFELELKNGLLVGRRIVTVLIGPTATQSRRGDSPQVYYFPCSLEYQLSAKRS